LKISKILLIFLFLTTSLILFYVITNFRHSFSAAFLITVLNFEKPNLIIKQMEFI